MDRKSVIQISHHINEATIVPLITPSTSLHHHKHQRDERRPHHDDEDDHGQHQQQHQHGGIIGGGSGSTSRRSSTSSVSSTSSSSSNSDNHDSHSPVSSPTSTSRCSSRRSSSIIGNAPIGDSEWIAANTEMIRTLNMKAPPVWIVDGGHCPPILPTPTWTSRLNNINDDDDAILKLLHWMIKITSVEWLAATMNDEHVRTVLATLTNLLEDIKNVNSLAESGAEDIIDIACERAAWLGHVPLLYHLLRARHAIAKRLMVLFCERYCRPEAIDSVNVITGIGFQQIRAVITATALRCPCGHCKIEDVHGKTQCGHIICEGCYKRNTARHSEFKCMTCNRMVNSNDVQRLNMSKLDDDDLRSIINGHIPRPLLHHGGKWAKIVSPSRYDEWRCGRWIVWAAVRDHLPLLKRLPVAECGPVTQGTAKWKNGDFCVTHMAASCGNINVLQYLSSFGFVSPSWPSPPPFVAPPRGKLALALIPSDSVVTMTLPTQLPSGPSSPTSSSSAAVSLSSSAISSATPSATSSPVTTPRSLMRRRSDSIASQFTSSSPFNQLLLPLIVRTEQPVAASEAPYPLCIPVDMLIHRNQCTNSHPLLTSSSFIPSSHSSNFICYLVYVNRANLHSMCIV
jgi:hypothetical protein